MQSKLIIVVLTAIFGLTFAEYTDPHCGGKQVIVHLFEWKWTDIALECERFLSQKGFCGVQVSPANEHVMVTSPPAPWWERYQPVSYKLQSRSGTEAEFGDMVQRCKKVGVRIYVDVVLNHMSGIDRNGTGSAGSSFNGATYDFPGVPYVKEHFNKYCPLNSYNDAHTIRDCHLLGLSDLNQKIPYVQNKIAAFLNTLIDYGVAGFRVDAAKHMWPKDIIDIQQKLKDMPEGGRPFFVHEVIDQSNGPITTQHYTSLGYVTEFRYCQKLKEGIEDFGRLGGVVDFGWGMTDSDHAFVFVDNHDNERGHGGGGSIITFEKPKDYKLAAAFVLANDYGFARVMSSYAFGDNSDLGPPHNADYSTKDVTVNADGVSCADGWVCEHRWRPVANMVAFRNAVAGTDKEHYFNQNQQIAFARGNKGFFAMARDGHMDQTLQTGLPAGEYCNLITDCATKITVDGSGMAHILINNEDEPIVAFIVGGPSSSSGSGSGGESSGGSGSPSTTHSGSWVFTTEDSGQGAFTTATSGSVTGAPTAPAGWSRTVIMIEKQTVNGQDLFIRGGLDHSQHKGCTSVAATSQCAIPIKDRQLGTSTHYAKYNAWSANDNYLDWYGSEPNQGRYHGAMAQGTPAVWTTNQVGQSGHNDLNTYGMHYWLADVDMDCSRIDNGWFEFKAIVNDEWERDLHADTCTGSGIGTPPSSTNNHWARCGMMNVFHFGSGSCQIMPIP